MIVALTGTDLYRDIEASAEARRSLEIATRLVVLQPRGVSELARHLRPKTRVVFQSAATRLAHRPPRSGFRLAVVGNLREEKDPFRTVMALAHLPSRPDIEVVQIGGSYSPAMAKSARGWMRHEPRYRWIGSKPHGDALRRMAASHLLVVSSVMEGGANVICEASRMGLPVLASRVSGNIGMLGAGYAGYFPLFDERKLARLIERASGDPAFYSKLKKEVLARRALFAPSAERLGLARLLREVA